MVTVTALVLGLILINALYVAAEFAAVGVRRSRIRELADTGDWLAGRLLPVVNDPRLLDRYVATSQIGITLSSLILGAYAQVAIALPLADFIAGRGWLDVLAARSMAATTVLVVTTVLQVLLGELVPKSAALRYPTAVGRLTVVPMQWSMVGLRWFIEILNGSAGVLLRTFRIAHAEGHRHIHSPDEIELLIAESSDGGLLEPEEQRRLHRALRLGLRTARQLMVPRTDVLTVDLRAAGDQMLARILDSPYSRLPVIDGTIDNVVGVIHVRDVVSDYVVSRSTDRLKALVRQMPAVPEGMRADTLLRLFRAERAEIVLVVDEFGGFSGIVTLSDVVGELIGSVDLPDQDDRIEALADGRLRVPAHLAVLDLPSPLASLWPQDADTIAGLILRVAGRLPEVGETVSIAGVDVEVERIADRVPASVLVTLPPPEPADG